MKDSLKKFYNEHATSRTTSLSSESKQRIKFNLMRKINNMSLQDYEDISSQESHGFYAILSNIRYVFSKNYIVVPLIAILLIGGTSVASADSVPGDALYPVKRSLETFTVMITPSEKEKNELKIRYAEQRIVELETLERRGEITEDTKTENEIEVQSDKTQSDKSIKDSDKDSKNSTHKDNTKIDDTEKFKAGVNSNFKSASKSSSKKIRKYRRISPEVQKQFKQEVDDARKFLIRK